MSEENQGTPVVPVITPDTGKSGGTGGINLATADLSLLKAEFEKAIADRAAIDARISGLRKAIAGRLKEFQTLNDKVSNIQYSSGKSSGFTLPSIPWTKVRSFMFEWVIPAVILFVLLWFGVKGVKNYYTAPKSDKIPIEQSIIPGHNVQTDFGQEDEQWS